MKYGFNLFSMSDCAVFFPMQINFTFLLILELRFLRKYLTWPHNFLLQISRSFFLFFSTICFFYAISVISLAKALTLTFVAPIIVTILSALLLKEKVGIHRWLAVFVGFIGALIVIQPGFIKINFASLSPALTFFSMEFFLLFRVSRSESISSVSITSISFIGSILLFT